MELANQFDDLWKTKQSTEKGDEIAAKMLKNAPDFISKEKPFSSQTLGFQLYSIKALQWARDWKYFNFLCDMLIDERTIPFLQYHILLTLRYFAEDYLIVRKEENLSKLTKTLSEFNPPNDSARKRIKEEINSLLICTPTIPTVSSTKDSDPPILVIADIHGNLDRFNKIIEEGISLSKSKYNCAFPIIVTLGDYCDNGPKIPELLDRLIDLQLNYPGKFLSIVGNHDLACLCTLEYGYRGSITQDWWNTWHHYWNYPLQKNATPFVYKCNTQEEFIQNFPLRHKYFLQNLPWAQAVGKYLFVHHGLPPPEKILLPDFPEGAPKLEEQLVQLAMKDLSIVAEGQLSIYLSKKTLPKVYDEQWPFVVVSGHCKFFEKKDFLAPNRLTFHSGACKGEPIHAALLPPVPKLGKIPVGHFFEI